MMRHARSVIACILVFAPCGLIESAWPPDNAAPELGLPSSTEGEVEIRVWLGGGALEPSELYRVIKLNGVVTVERIAWTVIPKETEGLYTAKGAAGAASRMRQFLTKQVCVSPPTQTGTYFLCHEPIDLSGPWSV